MNSQAAAPNRDQVDARHPRSTQPLSSHENSPNESQSTIRPRPVDDPLAPVERNNADNSTSPQPTILPFAPSAPRHSTTSTPDFFSRQQIPQHHLSLPPQAYNAPGPIHSPVVRFDEAQLAIFAMDNAARIMSIKDELAIAAGKVTPGVDDTPYIQYALDALTRDRRDSYSHFPSGSTEDYAQDAFPAERVVHEEMAYPPLSPPELAHLNRQPQQPRQHAQNTPMRHEPVAETPKATTEKPSAKVAAAAPKVATPDRWGAVTKDMREDLDPREKTYPPLTYKPRMLRPFSMMILMTMCLAMLAGLIFSAVYSDLVTGLAEYPGTMYSGRYFVFRILPQILASIILLYTQAIVTASYRTLPFTIMAREDPRDRRHALFRSLYPKTFLLPQFTGPWQLKLFSIAAWLTLFTIPLQSAAFTCILYDGEWIWAAVQGVIWSLVFIYVFLVVSTAILMVYWFGQWTGLLWDIRSIADLLPLLNRSNTMGSYQQVPQSSHGETLKAQLHDRWFDRLGYWHSENGQTPGVWYAIGTSAVGFDKQTKAMYTATAKRASYDPSVDSREYPQEYLAGGSFKYLPWHLRDGPVFTFVGVAGVLLMALLVVCFLPQTRLEDGFRPLLSASPSSAAFSAANFLYSFLPSLLGMVLFLLFQSIDMSLRILQPWAELRNADGSVAHKSILLDYASSLPFQCTIKAIRNGHWRIAISSLMAVLFVFIPILSGGLLMALTRQDGAVRMFPSMPVLGVLLSLLVLYVACLMLLIPGRAQLRLPHPVNSLASIISLCAAEELTQDAAFRAVRSREDLEGRLGLGRDDPREESMWFFGVVPGRDENLLSVRRMKRFTEKRMKSPRSSRSMV